MLKIPAKWGDIPRIWRVALHYNYLSLPHIFLESEHEQIVKHTFLEGLSLYKKKQNYWQSEVN